MNQRIRELINEFENGFNQAIQDDAMSTWGDTWNFIDDYPSIKGLMALHNSGSEADNEIIEYALGDLISIASHIENGG